MPILSQPAPQSKPKFRPRHDWTDWRREHRLQTLESLRRRYGRPGAVRADDSVHVYFDDHAN